jgi:hypothetical protein
MRGGRFCRHFLELKMNITFLGDVQKEAEAYLATCRRIYAWGDETICVTVHAHPRDLHGWLEWLICIRRSDGSLVITIALIQREVGGQFEFHS